MICYQSVNEITILEDIMSSFESAPQQILTKTMNQWLVWCNYETMDISLMRVQ